MNCNSIFIGLIVCSTLFFTSISSQIVETVAAQLVSEVAKEVMKSDSKNTTTNPLTEMLITTFGGEKVQSALQNAQQLLKHDTTMQYGERNSNVGIFSQVRLKLVMNYALVEKEEWKDFLVDYRVNVLPVIFSGVPVNIFNEIYALLGNFKYCKEGRLEKVDFIFENQDGKMNMLSLQMAQVAGSTDRALMALLMESDFKLQDDQIVVSYSDCSFFGCDSWQELKAISRGVGQADIIAFLEMLKSSMYFMRSSYSQDLNKLMLSSKQHQEL